MPREPNPAPRKRAAPARRDHRTERSEVMFEPRSVSEGNKKPQADAQPAPRKRAAPARRRSAERSEAQLLKQKLQALLDEM